MANGSRSHRVVGWRWSTPLVAPCNGSRGSRTLRRSRGHPEVGASPRWRPTAPVQRTGFSWTHATARCEKPGLRHSRAEPWIHGSFVRSLGRVTERGWRGSHFHKTVPLSGRVTRTAATEARSIHRTGYRFQRGLRTEKPSSASHRKGGAGG